MKHSIRTIALLLTTILLVGGCGSGDDTSATATSAPTGESGDPETPAPESGDDPVEADPSAELPGEGALEIVLDDGRSWSLEQYKCNYTPDNEGTFVELWGAGAAVENGGEFIVAMATPADPEKTENLLSGTFIDDANDILFPIVEGEAVSDGVTMTMTLGMYADGFKVVGDPIDFTATVTCQL